MSRPEPSGLSAPLAPLEPSGGSLAGERPPAPLSIAASAVAMLPWAWLRALGKALGVVAGSLLRIRRRHVEQAMRRAGVPAPAAAASAMYASLGTGLLELLWMAGQPARSLASLVRFSPDALALLERCRANRRGLVVATAHTGNWDLVACAAAERASGRLLVVTKRLKLTSFDRFWQTTRARRGVRLAEPRGALAAARGVLSAGGVVAVLVDQAPERISGVASIPFLGSDAAADLVAPLLAARAKVPLALVVGRRLPDGSHAVDLLDLREPPVRAGRAWAEQAMRALSRRLESFVAAYPDQWLWLHRRWKKIEPRRRGEDRGPARREGGPLVAVCDER